MKNLFNPGSKPPTGRYILVGPRGGEIKERGHRHMIVKIVNDHSSKLPSETRKRNQMFKRIINR